MNKKVIKDLFVVKYCIIHNKNSDIRLSLLPLQPNALLKPIDRSPISRFHRICCCSKAVEVFIVPSMIVFRPQKRFSTNQIKMR